jgi:hypothetical protein
MTILWNTGNYSLMTQCHIPEDLNLQWTLKLVNRLYRVTPQLYVLECLRSKWHCIWAIPYFSAYKTHFFHLKICLKNRVCPIRRCVLYAAKFRKIFICQSLLYSFTFVGMFMQTVRHACSAHKWWWCQFQFFYLQSRSRLTHESCSEWCSENRDSF